MNAQVQEWTWKDGLGSRSRKPACLVVTKDGSVYEFKDADIPNVVRIVKKPFTKNGKWSYTEFHCVSPLGTSTVQWMEDFETGEFWPQASWQEAYDAVAEKAPQVRMDVLQAIIRSNFPSAGEKFDASEHTIAGFVGSATVQTLNLANESHWVVENIAGLQNASVDGDKLVLQFAGKTVTLTVSAVS